MSHNEKKFFLQSIFDFYARTFQYIFAIISDPDKVKVQKMGGFFSRVWDDSGFVELFLIIQRIREICCHF